AAHAEQAEAARAAGAGAADGAADGAGTGELADSHPDAVTQVLPVIHNGTSHNGHGAAAALFDGAIADGAVVAGAGHGGAGHSGAGLGGSIDGGRHALADTNVQPVPALVAHGEPIGTHAGTAAPAASSVANALATGSPLGKTPQTQGGQGISRDRVHGVVRTADRGVVANAVLTLIDSDGRQVDRVLAGDDGKYAMGAPGNGAYVLIASAPAHQPQASPVMVGPAPVSMDIVLTGTSGLLGRVTAAGSGAAGKPATPVVGATATLADGRGEVVGARQTDDAGEYAFTELVAGDYTLVVNADRYRPAALPVSIAGGDRKRQDVELVSGATLSGVAIAAATERPVVDARITLLDSAGNVVGVTNTDDSGGYHFGDLAEGEYTVIASGYPPVASTLRVAGGELGEHHVRFDHPDI
ncbi:MAG: carboxypeptidase regulatory-like domain-containing protein, partial [Sciscionella sp.]|nr:carboxypeptidase regulatory-like domain-containing protein [Sciscionella sp.]